MEEALVASPDLREQYGALVRRDLARDIRSDDPRYACNVAFAGSRIDEGLELAAHFRGEYGERRLVVVDVGAGNGGVALGVASEAKNFVVALDIQPNATVVELSAATGIRLLPVVASADALPFRDGSVDVVLCLETIEHLPDAPAAAREMMQVCRPGGQVMVTTPPRLRYLLRPDPHYAIRGLLLLPDALQRLFVERWLRRGERYDVEHIYWTTRSIIRSFPGRGRTETLIHEAWPPPPRNPAAWWQLARHHFWKRLRGVLWDRIVIYRK